MRLYRIIYKYLPLFIYCVRLLVPDVVKLKLVGKDPTSHHAPCVVFVGVLIPDLLDGCIHIDPRDLWVQ